MVLRMAYTLCAYGIFGDTIFIRLKIISTINVPTLGKKIKQNIHLLSWQSSVLSEESLMDLQKSSVLWKKVSGFTFERFTFNILMINYGPKKYSRALEKSKI